MTSHSSLNRITGLFLFIVVLLVVTGSPFVWAQSDDDAAPIDTTAEAPPPTEPPPAEAPAPAPVVEVEPPAQPPVEVEPPVVEAPPTVVLPLVDTLDNPQAWLPNGGWSFVDAPDQGRLWFANTAGHMESALEYAVAIQMIGVHHPQLVLRQQGALGAGDVVVVEVSPDGSGLWLPVSQQVGSTIAAPWHEHYIDLGPFVGQTVRLRLHVIGGGSTGYWLDQITIGEYVTPPQPVVVPPAPQLPIEAEAPALPDDAALPDAEAFLPPAEPLLSEQQVAPLGYLAEAESQSAPQVAAAPANAFGTGLYAEYFNNMTLSGTPITRIDPEINFYWHDNVPMAGVPKDAYSVRWTGRIVPRYSELYTFYAESDDGVRLWVNGQQLVNSWVSRGPTTDTASITLQAGQPYDIRVEYFENAGYATMTLWWSSASQRKEIIPASQLFPASGPAQPPAPPTQVPPTATLVPTIPPTSTPVPPTATLLPTIPPTSTPVPPTATLVPTIPPTSTPVPPTRIPPTVTPVPPTSVPPTQPPAQSGSGLYAEYYNNKTLSGTPVTRIDPEVNFYWGQGGPGGGIGNDNFSARWTGQVMPRQSETYTFYVESDDGVRLWINGQQMVNSWVNRGPTTDTARITLQAGQRYDIRVEYFENTGYATMTLWWSSPSQPKQIIPRTQLFPATGQPLPPAPPTQAPPTQAPPTATLIPPTPVPPTATLRPTNVPTIAPTVTTVPPTRIPPTNTPVPPTATLRPTNTPAPTQPPAQSGSGLYAEYYNNKTLSGTPVTRIDPEVNFYWGQGGPGGGIGNDNFSARWTGQVVPRYSETYTFYVESDDGVRLWVNGQQLVNSWVNRGPTTDAARITLQAGQRYDIRVEYYEATGYATMNLWWSSASQPRQIIPRTQLFPATGQPLPPAPPTQVPPTTVPPTATVPPTRTPVPPTAAPPNPGQFQVPFNGNSIWNRRIPANPTIHPNSAAMIQLLADKSRGAFNIDGIEGAWSVPVFHAGPNDPLHTVCDSAGYRPCVQVRVPAGFSPSPDADRKAVIIESFQSPPRAWSFYGMSRVSSNRWTALVGAYGWGDISSNGDGLRHYDGGEWGGRVAGWNYYAGLIHPEEIRAGRINHALNLNLPADAACRCAVWPGIYGDGTNGSAAAIPIGSWIQLDPSIDVESLNLSRSGKIIARALQEYGAWVGDTGGMAAFSAREFVRLNASGQPYVDASPWQGLLSYRDTYYFPVQHLRVIVPNQADFYRER